jgi:phosphoglycolate phosphatase
MTARSASHRRTLLIDLDGTLTDNFVGISRSIAHALAVLGTPVDDLDALRSCVGPPLRRSFARLLPVPDPATIERAIALFRERYGEIGWAENVVYDGVGAAVAALAAQGHALHLCTSKAQPYAQRIVERFGFAEHLAGVYGTDLAGSLDDKSTLVAHLLTCEGLAAGDCAMIGDREYDIRAARNNGMAAIGVLWGYGSRAELEEAGAHAIVAVPAALDAAIAGLDGAR